MLLGGAIGVSISVLVAMGISERPEAASSVPAVGSVAFAPATGVPAQRALSWHELERDDGAPSVSEGVWDVAAHDMDGDTLSDLVFATGGPGSTTGQVSVLSNPGSEAPLTSWQRVSFETRADYGRVAVGDIDGDGVHDAVMRALDPSIPDAWFERLAESVRALPEYGVLIPGWSQLTRPGGAARPALRVIIACLDRRSHRTLSVRDGREACRKLKHR